ncbi:phytoene dehydrogenase-like oxidoreductase [Mycobacterium senegalense]|uniref:Phytoene dehydrogenase-like oxidoreductase n=1 Tax=Mycolicibacterium senegalense TaxID=1796 RepID=A0A378T3E6_9MYCO|nr:phytoene dehydrogenase-like protein [Mycolicibacterium senegalense]STZ55338.1 phytoene dehydrogenase-like oxidoreductase [Mycolicibacterium senegalense]
MGVDVTIVGSGPNGLSAAVICARAGLSVRVIEAQPTAGGGARSAADPEYPDVLHDVCSAVHPMGVVSPFFAEFDLAARGVELRAPEISYANPLPSGRAAIAYRSLDRTCDELERGASWRRLFGPLVEHSDGVLGFFLGDKRSLPPDLPTTVRTGLRVLAQGSPAWGVLRGDDARALFTGVGTHAISRMPSPVNSGAGIMLGTVAHTAGWPIPVGGTQRISDALIADLRAHGGELITSSPVTDPPGGVVIYDTAPTALLDIYGDSVPARYAKALRRYRYGPGVCKIDFVLSGEIPWRDPRMSTSPTVHLGGTRAQMATAEREVAAGRHARRPMTLAALPHLVDPGRVDAQGRRPLWTYSHVPANSPADLTETVTAMFEEAAPGFRDLVLAARAVPADQMSQHNANYVRGDIIVGGATLFAAMVGPTLRANPWTTPIPKAYLCSSATPPGTAVHGMAGLYAARTVLKREFGITELPKLAP